MDHSSWNSVVPTPPHPEYTAAHAVISSASAMVLGSIFGTNYPFTDHTYEITLGARSFNSFKDYAKEAGLSRLLGGLHYRASIEKGLAQGEMVGKAVNNLNLRNIQ